MAKGKKANKLMMRLVQKHIGTYTDPMNPMLPYFAKEVSDRIGYSARTILRSYRHRSTTIRTAAKNVLENDVSLEEYAQKKGIKVNVLENAIHQYWQECY